MSNNPKFYNAALAGALGGASSGYLTNPDPASYTSQVTASAAFAQALDTALPPNVDAECEWPILFAICINYWQGRFPVSADVASYAEEVAAITALFTQALTVTDISQCGE